MADVSLTVALIRPLEGATVRRFNAGGALTPGQLVYVATDGDVEAADGNALAASQARGIVIADGSGSAAFVAGDRVDVVVHGPVTGFSSATVGAIGYSSELNVGGINQTKPATAGDYPFAAGYFESAVTFFVQPQITLPVVNS